MSRRLRAAMAACALLACGCGSQHPAPVDERSAPGALRGTQPVPASVPLGVAPPAEAATVPLAPPAAVQSHPLGSSAAASVPPSSAAVPPPQPLPPGVVTEPRALKLPYSDQAYAQLMQAAPAAIAPVPAAAGDEDIAWGWPASGEIKMRFDAKAGATGLNIAGGAGQPVLAAAAGTVLYSGSGMRGYGNLVIIKHNATYSSVYAYNSRLLVKEHDTVLKGQKIAEMGDTESPAGVQLHFEIRRGPTPVDPLTLLPAR